MTRSGAGSPGVAPIRPIAVFGMAVVALDPGRTSFPFHHEFLVAVADIEDRQT